MIIMSRDGFLGAGIVMIFWALSEMDGASVGWHPMGLLVGALALIALALAGYPDWMSAEMEKHRGKD